MTAQLGFLEPLEWTQETQNDFSISRLGGLPTWPIDNPPPRKDLLCQTCSRPLRLLIQLYAPTDDEEILRLIYIFLCKDGRCQKPGFSPACKVLRIQTPWSSIKNPKLCPICNFPGDLPHENLTFCTQDHLDRHQRSLKSTRPKSKFPPQDISWKPMEIVSEEEPPSPSSDLSLSSLSLTSSRVETDESVADEKYTKSIGDRTFQKFLRRIERAPEQVLRYLRVEGTTAEVLRCAADGAVEGKKRCRGCGGETGVEVQVMPGLLAQMESDVGGKEELDWGVLNVLTCLGNCAGKEEGYVEEYLWKQDVSQEGLKSEADM